MRRTILIMLVALPLLGGCPPICDCGDVANAPLPLGEFEIDYAWHEALAEGTAVLTEEQVTFFYTDEDGNDWEIEYAIGNSYPE
jgi:hypothetical protein